MDLEDAGSQARFLIRDRDGKFPGLFDAVLKDAGIKTVLSGVLWFHTAPLRVGSWVSDVCAGRRSESRGSPWCGAGGFGPGGW